MFCTFSLSVGDAVGMEFWGQDGLTGLFGMLPCGTCTGGPNGKNVFLAVLDRTTNFVEIPKRFYARYSGKIPLKVTLEDQFGTTFGGVVAADEGGRGFIVTNAGQMCEIYGYEHYAVARMTYVSKSKFKVFVPDSSRYFDLHGPFAGEEGTDSEPESDVEDVSLAEEEIVNVNKFEGPSTSGSRMGGYITRSRAIEIQQKIKTTIMEKGNVEGNTSGCKSDVGGFKG